MGEGELWAIAVWKGALAAVGTCEFHARKPARALVSSTASPLRSNSIRALGVHRRSIKSGKNPIDPGLVSCVASNSLSGHQSKRIEAIEGWKARLSRVSHLRKVSADSTVFVRKWRQGNIQESRVTTMTKFKFPAFALVTSERSFWS